MVVKLLVACLLCGTVCMYGRLGGYYIMSAGASWWVPRVMGSHSGFRFGEKALLYVWLNGKGVGRIRDFICDYAIGDWWGCWES